MCQERTYPEQLFRDLLDNQTAAAGSLYGASTSNSLRGVIGDAGYPAAPIKDWNFCPWDGTRLEIGWKFCPRCKACLAMRAVPPADPNPYPANWTGGGVWSGIGGKW
jgi:hypothetical protein